MPPFQLAYDAPPECPNQAAFVDGVRSRLPADFEDSAGEVVAVDVRVTRVAEGYRAVVGVPAARGQRATRSVSGKSCENVVRGSALVTALALEARVADEAASQSAESEAAGPPPPPAEPPPASAPPSPDPAPSPPVPAKTDSPVSTRPSRPAPAPSSAPDTLELLLAARGSLATGIAPAPALGLGLFAGARYFAFGVGLTLESTRSGDVRSSGVPAEYALDCARLEAGASLPLAPSLALEGLLSFEGGVLGAEALPDPPLVVEGTRGSVAWLAPGAGARLRVSGGPLFASGEAFARAPLVRERFFVDIEGERRVAHRVPYFSVGGALMAGARF